MAVWVRPDLRTEFSNMRMFFRQFGTVLKVRIWAGFGSGLLKNAC